MVFTKENDSFERVRGLNFELNTRCLSYSAIHRILTKMGVIFPTNLIIKTPVFIDTGNIKIGDNCFINHNCKFIDYGGITIGNNVGISCGVTIIANDHPGNPLLLDEWVDIPAPVVIEDDVWIGANVTILGPVTIGKGAIIGSCSLVNKDIPAGVVAFGCPAKPMYSVEEYLSERRQTVSDQS